MKKLFLVPILLAFSPAVSMAAKPAKPAAKPPVKSKPLKPAPVPASKPQVKAPEKNSKAVANKAKPAKPDATKPGVKPSKPPVATKPSKPTPPPVAVAPSQYRKGGFKGSISFTPQEIQLHKISLSPLLKNTATCTQNHLDRQKAFYRKYGISKYYGYESDWNKKLSKAEKEAFLKNRRIPLEVLSQLAPTSCINLTLDCLKEGFLSTGQEAAWEKIRAFTLLNDQSGLALQLALQGLGWKVIYWIPDTNAVRIWDEEERKAYPDNRIRFWGWHEERLRQVTKFSRYYHNPVDDKTSLVNFGAKLPPKFLKIPYFVGTVHSGFHVFNGSYGFVIEGHNSKKITDYDNIEGGMFDPTGINNTGWFSSWISRNGYHPDGTPYGIYRSGLMAVPPGYGF